MQLDRPVGPRCNIGPAEIARRRFFAILATVGTAGLVAVLLALHASPPWRLLIWPFAAGTGVAWLQVTQRFCVNFGIRGLENLGSLGDEHAVGASVRREDRRRALLLIAQGGAIGGAVALVVLLLPA